MKLVLRLLLYPIALFVILTVAHSLGDIWDRRANPVPFADVTLIDGTRIRGLMSREWDGRYTVTQADGRAFAFQLADVNLLSIPPSPSDPDSFASPEPKSATSIDWAHWRSYLVLYAALVACVGLLYAFDPDFLRRLVAMPPRARKGRRGPASGNSISEFSEDELAALDAMDSSSMRLGAEHAARRAHVQPTSGSRGTTRDTHRRTT